MSTLALSEKPKILVIGATGSTGLRAVQGLLDVGFQPQDLVMATRNPQKPRMLTMKRLGFGVVSADLGDPTTLKDLGKGCKACYIHATGCDTAALDESEVSNAKNLCNELHKDVTRVIYNSAAAAQNHGVRRIQQKHDVEQVFQDASQNGRSFIALRSNIFMEELWKEYTRPQILKGTYPIPVPSTRKIYFISVRDLGRLAGSMFLSHTPIQHSEIINVAGDWLTGPEIAKHFEESQHSQCTYYQNSELTQMAIEQDFQELLEEIRFLQTSEERTDIRALRDKFPDLLTSFAEFLAETNWENRTLTFEDFANPEALVWG